MGALISKIFRIFEIKSRVLLLGLDCAGKTTLLYKLRLGQTVTTIPTIGFNVENIQYKKLNITMWDVGGQDKLRGLWKHYFKDADVLVYMIDGSDASRFNETQEEFFKIITDTTLLETLKYVLIYLNKKDTVEFQNIIQNIHDILGLHRLKVKYHVQECCALNGDGVLDGLEEMYNFMIKST